MTGSSPKMMNAWRVEMGKSEPYRAKVPTPTPEPKGLLVRLLAMGVCHSDCTILAMKDALENWKSDFVLGHEGAGEVVALGSDIDPAEFRIGDRVAIHIIPGCDAPDCLQCSRGLHRICRAPGSGNYGLGQDGMFAEFVAVHRRAAVKVPAGVTDAQAAIAPDAVLTAYHAVKYAAAVQPHHVVLILGLGGLGLNAVQTAQHLGVRRLFVADRRPAAVDAAVQLGVPRAHAFCTDGPDARPVDALLAERGVVVDLVLDFVGHEQTVASAQRCVRPAGTIVLVGLLSAQAPLMPLVVASNVLTLKGSYNGTLAGLAECLALLAEGAIRPEIVTGSIEDLPRVLRELDAGRINGRMVLLPSWKE